LCVFGVKGERPEIEAGHGTAAEQIGPGFGRLAEILDDESLWSRERFVVDDDFGGSAAQCLVSAEEISGEGFGFLATVETIAGYEEQQPDAGCHLVDEDVLGKFGEWVKAVRRVAVPPR